MTPMLLCRVPSIPKQYSRERLNQLATPKVKTTHVKAFQRSPDGLLIRYLERPFGRIVPSFE